MPTQSPLVCQAPCLKWIVQSCVNPRSRRRPFDLSRRCGQNVQGSIQGRSPANTSNRLHRAPGWTRPMKVGGLLLVGEDENGCLSIGGSTTPIPFCPQKAVARSELLATWFSLSPSSPKAKHTHIGIGPFGFLQVSLFWFKVPKDDSL